MRKLTDIIEAGNLCLENKEINTLTIEAITIEALIAMPHIAAKKPSSRRIIQLLQKKQILE